MSTDTNADARGSPHKIASVELHDGRLGPKQAKAVGVLEADLLDEWEHSASGAATGQS